MHAPDEGWATPSEAAKYLRTTPGGLSQLRHKGGGPVFVKTPSGRVLYAWADLVRWPSDHKYTRTGSKVTSEA